MKNAILISRVVLFRSQSNPNKTHETVTYTDGSMSCSCPGWCKRVMADGSRACVHTRLLDARFEYKTHPLFITETWYYHHGMTPDGASNGYAKAEKQPKKQPTHSPYAAEPHVGLGKRKMIL